MRRHLLRAWSKAKSLAREVRLYAELSRGGLMPLPDAAELVWRYLPERIIDELRSVCDGMDLAYNAYAANAIAVRYPIWGCANGHAKLARIPFSMSSGLDSSVQEEGWRLSFTSYQYGWFDDLHVDRRHVLRWVKDARALHIGRERVDRWPYRGPRFAGPPVNPDRSVIERQGQDTDFVHEEVEEMLRRKLEVLAKSPVKVDVGKPKKRWKKVLKRKNARRKA